ncbi:hypothetical protein D3C87_1852740 [compost metagenome]
MDGVDGQGVEMVPAFAPAPLGDDEASLFEHTQMLHDGAAVEFGKGRAEIAGRGGAGLEHVKHAPPDAVAESLENEVVCVVG